MINPASLAFDIDGVCADTMSLFLDIARDEYHINHIRYQDITSYRLEDCLNIDPATIHDIVIRILDGNYTCPLRPILGAPQVLSRIARHYGPVIFVTARPYLGPIGQWLLDELNLNTDEVEVIATGTYEAKVDVLLERNISCFVEDRLETCFSVSSVGVSPVLFRQPWNRRPHPFIEVGNWQELESLLGF
jgi:uncharacterized HAD superfamily protein